MAGRIRSIKPELREHGPFANLTDAAARLFLMLYTLADDEGRCPASPEYLAGAVFFGRRRRRPPVNELLQELDLAGLIERYTVHEGPHLAIRGWHERSSPTHQRIEKPQPARFPGPSTTDSRSAPGILQERSGTDRDRDRDQDQDKELSLPRAHAIPPAGTPQGPEPAPEVPPVIEERRQLGDRAWDRLVAKRAELAERHGWKDVRPLHLMDPGRTELAARIRECGADAEQSVEHVLQVAFAEAEAKQTIEFLTGSMFRAASWAKKLGMRVSDAKLARASPRAGSAIGAASPRNDHPESNSLTPCSEVFR